MRSRPDLGGQPIAGRRDALSDTQRFTTLGQHNCKTTGRQEVVRMVKKVDQDGRRLKTFMFSKSRLIINEMLCVYKSWYGSQASKITTV